MQTFKWALSCHALDSICCCILLKLVAALWKIDQFFCVLPFRFICRSWRRKRELPAWRTANHCAISSFWVTFFTLRMLASRCPSTARSTWFVRTVRLDPLGCIWSTPRRSSLSLSIVSRSTRQDLRPNHGHSWQKEIWTYQDYRTSACLPTQLAFTNSFYFSLSVFSFLIFSYFHVFPIYRELAIPVRYKAHSVLQCFINRSCHTSSRTLPPLFNVHQFVFSQGLPCNQYTVFRS